MSPISPPPYNLFVCNIGKPSGEKQQRWGGGGEKRIPTLRSYSPLPVCRFRDEQHYGPARCPRWPPRVGLTGDHGLEIARRADKRRRYVLPRPTRQHSRCPPRQATGKQPAGSNAAGFYAPVLPCSRPRCRYATGDHLTRPIIPCQQLVSPPILAQLWAFGLAPLASSCLWPRCQVPNTLAHFCPPCGLGIQLDKEKGGGSATQKGPEQNAEEMASKIETHLFPDRRLRAVCRRSPPPVPHDHFRGFAAAGSLGRYRRRGDDVRNLPSPRGP
ncbi:hypothetical protein B0T25DRAFT_89721 [Lasiosphaeria hispida]|uniref:Uncharacterized protein n=1 Tax=Lasiosphaeria hispida TaxID=260671 RepID=A0AAJ0HPZ4_9PEZI|nr:hypothetical protein B0T25DRAFT_89721 [Lasiosphaeria hispida]